MPYRRYRKKNVAKKVVKKRSYRRKKIVRPHMSIVGVNRNAQVYNKQLKKAVHYYKDTINYQDINGAGQQITGLLQFDMGILPRYAALQSMYRQYRISSVKCIFKLRTIELTDNEQHPQMLIRYNYDPNLTIGSISENYMMRQANVVSKQFIHNTPEGTTLEYYFKPCVMHALRQWNTSGFIPSPKFNQWCDFTLSSTTEIAQYGLAYWISNLPTNQVIDFDLQVSYACRDII